MALSGTLQHKKTGRLARALGVSRWAALGLLEAFWDCVRTSARTGKIDPDQWEDIAEYCYFDRTGQELRQLLAETGFIDPMQGWDWVHDWHHYADNSTRTWLSRRGQNFANGAQARIPKDGYGAVENYGVETNGANVETNHRFVETTARARPEPEPEPEPEPAAAKSFRGSKGLAAAALEPPPPDPELAEIADRMHAAMPRGFDPPDERLVRQVVTLAGSVSAAADVVHRLRKRRARPDSYGLFVTAARDKPLCPDRAPPCSVCGGMGFFTPDVPHELATVGTLAEIDAWLNANRKRCRCQPRAG